MNIGEIVTSGLLKKADATSPIPVASTGTIYTPSFPMAGIEGFEFLAVSDDEVDVLVELETGSSRPSTEEAADTNFIEPDGLADLLNIKDKLMHTKQIDVPRTKFGRLKLTGQLANHASTTLQIKINRREYA